MESSHPKENIYKGFSPKGKYLQGVLTQRKIFTMGVSPKGKYLQWGLTQRKIFTMGSH